MLPMVYWYDVYYTGMMYIIPVLSLLNLYKPKVRESDRLCAWKYHSTTVSFNIIVNNKDFRFTILKLSVPCMKKEHRCTVHYIYIYIYIYIHIFCFHSTQITQPLPDLLVEGTWTWRKAPAAAFPHFSSDQWWRHSRTAARKRGS